MIELTETAREQFDSYLARLRSALKGAAHVEADEVEQNVREHVEVALAGVPGPIGADRLGSVLERLGPPERWIPEEERPGWKRALDRLRSGPEDWRLAYLAFAFFAVSFVFAPIGGMLLLIPGYVLSRATVSFLAEKGDRMGARRWLILPSMVMLLLPLAAAIVAGPPGGVVVWLIEEGGFDHMSAALERLHGVRTQEWPVLELTALRAGMVMAAFGTWWLIAAPLLLPLRRPLQIAFLPALDWWQRRHLAIMALVGAIVGAIGWSLLLYLLR
jgi:hypothetical protein